MLIDQRPHLLSQGVIDLQGHLSAPRQLVGNGGAGIEGIGIIRFHLVSEGQRTGFIFDRQTGHAHFHVIDEPVIVGEEARSADTAEAHLELPEEIAPASVGSAFDVNFLQHKRLQGGAGIGLDQHPIAEVVLEMHPQTVFRLRCVAISLGLVIIAQAHAGAGHAAEVERLQLQRIIPIRLAVEVERIGAAGGIVGAVVDVGVGVYPQSGIGIAGIGKRIKNRQTERGINRVAGSALILGRFVVDHRDMPGIITRCRRRIGSGIGPGAIGAAAQEGFHQHSVLEKVDSGEVIQRGAVDILGRVDPTDGHFLLAAGHAEGGGRIGDRRSAGNPGCTGFGAAETGAVHKSEDLVGILSAVNQAHIDILSNSAADRIDHCPVAGDLH